MTRPPTARAQAVNHSTSASITGSSVAAKTTTAGTLTGLAGPTDVPDAMTDADPTTLTVLGTVTAAAADKKKVVGAAYAATVLMTATENVHPKTINSSSNAQSPGVRTSTHHYTPNDTLHNRGLSDTSTNTSAVAYLSVSNKPGKYLTPGSGSPTATAANTSSPNETTTAGTPTCLVGPTDVPDTTTDADATASTVLGTGTAAAAGNKKVVGAAYAATVLMTATENVHPKTINRGSNAHAHGASTFTPQNAWG